MLAVVLVTVLVGLRPHGQQAMAQRMSPLRGIPAEDGD